MNQRRDHYRVIQLPNPCELISLLPRRKLPGTSRPGRPAGGQTKTLVILVDYLSVLFNKSKLSTTDLLVLASMKNAAKCDK